jgi:hypothetical protein
VIFVVVTELRDLPEPTADLVFPELTVNPAPPELKVQLVLRAPTEPRVLRALMVDAALLERRVLKARPALREPKALKVDPENANVFAHGVKWTFLER